MAYNRVNWEDSPSTNTPLNATNLNKMDAGIASCDEAIEDLQDSVEQLTSFLSQTLTAGQTTLVFQDAGITTNSMFNFYVNKAGVAYKDAVTVNGSLTLTFDAQDTDIVVKVGWI